MSAERRRLIEAMSGGGLVMATLVGVAGSSYRRPGARLVVAPDGAVTGTISGGCLEGDLLRRAGWLTREGPVVQHYSTAFDDVAEIPYGLGCGGELDVLLERSGTAAFGALREAMEASQAGEWRRVVTELPAAGGRGLRRAVWDEAGGAVFASDGFGAAESGGEGVYAEELAPPQRLIVLGAGEDARPLVRLGQILGWRVVVADGRRQMARAERFPEADEVVVLEHAGELVLRAEDAVVVMTHSYEQDRAGLVASMRAGVRYLGLLGARHRSCLLVSEAAAEGGWTVAESCERLHAPVGLDLGGDGPEAIALAVVAEIQGCVQGRPGGSRRLTAGEVAERAATADASVYAQARCSVGEMDEGMAGVSR